MTTANQSHTPYTIRKQGRQWAVYRGTELIEGGFFDRERAQAACAEYNAQASA